MGFTGRPSTGCTTCKQRKKKCDRTKPRCYRCTSTGRDCPGVPDEVDVLFRNEFVGDSSNEGVRNFRGRQSLRNSGVDLRLHSSANVDVESLTIGPVMPMDWLNTAMMYYFELHFQKDLLTRRLNPWLELQSSFFTSAKPGTGLSLAVGAFAALTMADDLRLPELHVVANIAYGNALRAIKAAISDPKEALKDEVAVGVFAITNYELKQRDAPRYRRYRTHLAGMRQLLVMRGRDQLANFQSLKVFRALRVQIVYDYMLRGIPLIDDGDEAMWTDASPYNASPVDDLCAVAALIPGLRVKVKQVTKMSIVPSPKDVLTDVVGINERLDQWIMKWADHVKYEIAITDGNIDVGWRGKMHVFTDLSQAVLMNHYYLLRVLILETMLTITETCDSTVKGVDLNKPVVSARIRSYVDDMCFSTSFITGQVRDKGHRLRGVPGPRWTYPSHADATWMLLPIVTTMMQKSIDKEPQAWLKKQLLTLNLEFGLIEASSLPRGSSEILKETPLVT